MEIYDTTSLRFVQLQLSAFSFTEETVDTGGKNSPVDNEIDADKWRWWVFFQEMNLR